MIMSRALESDLADIVALESDGFDHAGWSAAAWRDELISPDRHVLATRDFNGQVVGVATFQTVEDVADLHRVVVRSDVRSQGIGRQLVAAGVEWAEAMGASQMMLEVEAGNSAAHHLYSEMGFLPVHKRVDYYGPGRHALVMSRALNDPDEWLEIA